MKFFNLFLGGPAYLNTSWAYCTTGHEQLKASYPFNFFTDFPCSGVTSVPRA